MGVVVVGSGFGAAAVVRRLHRDGCEVRVIEGGPALPPRPGAHLGAIPGLGETGRWRSLASALADPPVRAPGPAIVGALPAGPDERVRADQGPDGVPGYAPLCAAGGSGIAWSGVVLPPHAPHGFGEEELAGAKGVLRSAPVRTELARWLERHVGLEPVPLAWKGHAPLGPAEVGGRGYRPEVGVRARRLELRGDRVTGVWVSAGESEHLVDAADVVVAAGVVGTTQLLWSSGIRPAALGVGISDHPVAFAQVGVPEPGWAASLESSRAPTALRAPPSVGTHVLVLAQPPWLLGGRVNAATVLSIWAYATVEPDARDRLGFLPEVRGPNGLPLPRIQLRVQAEASQRALGMAAAWAGRIGVPLPGSAARILPPGSSQHLAGGARIGASNDPLAVADLDGRVRGFENLWVAGAAALPGPVSTHPVQSIVALGTRTALALLAARRQNR